jgi:3-oxoacyl-[acyl-carrier protein] reductase
MPIDLKLEGKVAIVSGGTRGLGAASARLLAADGARLVLTDRDLGDLETFAEELRAAHQTETALVPCDLTHATAADGVAARAEDAFGRIDILINCAGASQGGVFWDIPDQVWQDSFALKFMGTIRMMRAVLPAMRRQKYGRIVTVVGDTGKQPRPRLLPGAAANAALLAVTKGLADEVAPDGISVNAVNPGPTRTERITTLFANLAASTGRPLADIEADFTEDSPFGTLGEPEDVARMIVLLASDAAKNITGSSITTDGGRSRALA